jgi:hypothetical protein
MKIEVIKAAVDRLKTSECRGTTVNTEALSELRELLSVPFIERADALSEARELLERVYDQGDTDGLIGEEIGNFLEQKHALNIQRSVEPFGYWMFPKGFPQHGIFHEPSPDIGSAGVEEVFEIKALYDEQPEIAGLRAELDRYKAAGARLGGTANGIKISQEQTAAIIEFLYAATGYQREVIERFQESVKHGTGSSDNEEHRIGLRNRNIEKIKQLQADLQALIDANPA